MEPAFWHARWEAGQTLARRMLADFAKSLEAGDLPDVDESLARYCGALAATLDDDQFDNAYKALALTPPTNMEILMAAAAMALLLFLELEK